MVCFAPTFCTSFNGFAAIALAHSARSPPSLPLLLSPLWLWCPSECTCALIILLEHVNLRHIRALRLVCRNWRRARRRAFTICGGVCVGCEFLGRKTTIKLYIYYSTTSSQNIQCSFRMRVHKSLSRSAE